MNCDAVLALSSGIVGDRGEPDSSVFFTWFPSLVARLAGHAGRYSESFLVPNLFLTAGGIGQKDDINFDAENCYSCPRYVHHRSFSYGTQWPSPLPAGLSRTFVSMLRTHVNCLPGSDCTWPGSTCYTAPRQGDAAHHLHPQAKRPERRHQVHRGEVDRNLWKGSRSASVLCE